MKTLNEKLNLLKTKKKQLTVNIYTKELMAEKNIVGSMENMTIKKQFI